MSEKVYKTMNTIGITNLITGIGVMVVGIGIGTLIIVSGARLLKSKSDLLF